MMKEYWRGYEGNIAFTYPRCCECGTPIGRLNKEDSVFDGVMLCKNDFQKLKERK